MNGSEAVREFCNVAVVNIPENNGDDFVDPVSVYGKKSSRESRKTQNARGAAENVEEHFFAEFDRAAFGISFELFGMPVLGKLADVSYQCMVAEKGKF